jgi:hypothetical protein
VEASIVYGMRFCYIYSFSHNLIHLLKCIVDCGLLFLVADDNFRTNRKKYLKGLGTFVT